MVIGSQQIITSGASLIINSKNFEIFCLLLKFSLLKLLILILNFVNLSSSNEEIIETA